MKEIKHTQLFPIIQGKKYGYIDRKGSIMIEPRFDYGGPFCDGVAVVRIGGKYVLEAFEDDNRRHRVLTGGEWGYIDNAGNYVISPRFSCAESFHEGIASVSIKGKYGFIDKAGNWIIIEPKFDLTARFRGGQNTNFGGHRSLGTSHGRAPTVRFLHA